MKKVLFVDLGKELLRELVVHFVGGARVYIERDAEVGKGLLHNAVVLVHERFGGNAFFFGADGYRHAVLVRPAHKGYVFTAQAQVAHIGIGGQVCAGDVADVQRAVGIRQRRGDHISLKLFHKLVS